MKLKFKAKAIPLEYDIQREVINGLDLSLFPVGGRFTPTLETLSRGIFHVDRDSTGQLLVTLGQGYSSYEVDVSDHAWLESGWIDATDYDPEMCHIIAANAPQGSEYRRLPDGRWTVSMPDDEGSIND